MHIELAIFDFAKIELVSFSFGDETTQIPFLTGGKLVCWLSHQEMSDVPPPKFTCDICSYTCKYKSRFTGHMVTHSNERPFACDVEGCTAAFKNSSDVSRHKRQVHSEERPIACDIEGCSHTCKSISTLKHHKRYTHSDERPVACDIEGCSFTCKANSDLTIHKRYVHSEERPIACDVEGCSHTCKSNSDLCNHKRHVHSEERPFACEFCPAASKTSSNLYTHVRVQHEGLRFECRKCSSEFTSKDSRDYHEEHSCGKSNPAAQVVEPQVVDHLYQGGLLKLLFDESPLAGREDIECYGFDGMFATCLPGLPFRPDALFAAKGWGTLHLEIDEQHHVRGQYKGDFDRLLRIWSEYVLPRGLGPYHVVRFKTSNGSAREVIPDAMERYLHEISQVVDEIHQEAGEQYEWSNNLYVYFIGGDENSPNIAEALSHKDQVMEVNGIEATVRIYHMP